jgi:hypothetical protein
MFPTLVFRRAYDAIQTPHRGVRGDVEYLRILHLAASTLQVDVEAALTLLFDEGKPISADAVKALVTTENQQPAVPELMAPEVDLDEYDRLLGGEEVAA